MVEKLKYKVKTYCHHCNNSDEHHFRTKKHLNEFLKDVEVEEIDILTINGVKYDRTKK